MINERLAFERCMNWINKNTISNQGIAVSSTIQLIYPEVTGYYIPSLINWGERDKAYNYAKYLISIQNSDGSFNDSSGSFNCLFDTGQILRGLLDAAIEFDGNIFKSPIYQATKWVASCIDIENSQVEIPEYISWGGLVNKGIILYAFEPALRSAKYLQDEELEKKIKLGIQFILNDSRNFDDSVLSHFHAYVIEALVDLGYLQQAKSEFNKVISRASESGFVAGHPNVDWICSTGLLQYSVIAYKLGEKKFGDLAFKAALSLQNRSGGWYGSYDLKHKSWLYRRTVARKRYFANSEISWANKYFLDALYLKQKFEFEELSGTFSSEIENHDGRAVLIDNLVKTLPKNATILDLGCGAGRYLKVISQHHSNTHGVDISAEVLKRIPVELSTKIGSLTKIPFNNKYFDFIYCVEALEHAINIKGCISEMNRVLKNQGTLVIIDKNKMKIKSNLIKKLPWEKYFSKKELIKMLEKHHFNVTFIKDITFEGNNSGVFSAWIAVKK